MFVASECLQCIVDGKRRLVTYKEWANLLQTSFEACYYVPLGMSDHWSPSVVH